MGLPGSPSHDRGAARYERDNLETLYGAIADGALDVKLPKHVKKELEAYPDCGLLCRGFARLRCGSCDESRLVAFSCKGRRFCPSCLGRRMCATAGTAGRVANAIREAATPAELVALARGFLVALPLDVELEGPWGKRPQPRVAGEA